MADEAMKKKAKIESISKMKIKDLIARMKEHPNETFEKHYQDIMAKMKTEFAGLR